MEEYWLAYMLSLEFLFQQQLFSTFIFLLSSGLRHSVNTAASVETVQPFHRREKTNKKVCPETATRKRQLKASRET